MSAPPAATHAEASPHRWKRFTLAERMMRSLFYVVVLLAIVWSLQSIEIIPEFLYDAPQQTVDLFVRMWPIDWAWYPKVVHAALIETLHTETPTPHNPLGAKGVGESGTIGSTPAVQNAVIDAVSHLGVRHIDMPMHPMRVWEAIRSAKG